MPNVDLTEMDLAVIDCLHYLTRDRESGVMPPDLVPCLQRRFPGNEELEMREGESLTRLRGRQLLGIDPVGHVRLTPLGTEMAQGLQMEHQEAEP